MQANKPALERGALGDWLVARGAISSEQLSICLQQQKLRRERLGDLIIHLGFISEQLLRDQLSTAFGYPSIDLSQWVPDSEALARVPSALARRHHLLPIAWDAQARKLSLAMDTPQDLIALDAVRAICPDTELARYLVTARPLLAAIERCYGFELSVARILEEIKTDSGGLSIAAVQAGEYRQPIVRLLDALLAEAVRERASDIHFEPMEHFVRIRYRIDGVMRRVHTLAKDDWGALCTRLKVMAQMDIAEKRAPQDGRISRTCGEHRVDFRVASINTVHGENLAVRLLDRDRGILPLDALELPPTTHDALVRINHRPNGITLVTGSTGSGKTTTLYSLLAQLDTERLNIMTLEDPVEYSVQNIRQCEVSAASKLSFVSGMRALLRQNPDVILIGEIRDAEVASMALEASLTGHQVYATLHTHSALGAVVRLLDMGLSPGVLIDNITAVLSQCLVRRLCPHCKQRTQPSSHQCHLFELEPSTAIYRAQGCPQCQGQGYFGRLALMEVLEFDAQLDALLYDRASMIELHQGAKKMRLCSIRADGIARVRQGITSLEELTRVVDLSERG